MAPKRWLALVLCAGCGAADGTVDTDARAVLRSDAATDADVAPGEGLPEACPGICNAVVPSNPVVTATSGAGNVTMYTTEPSHGGACNYGATAVAYFAAVNVNVVPGDGKGQWNGGRVCGQCAEVTTLTSQGRRSVVVRIMDRCADADCGMDLGGDAPAVVMPDGFGRYDGAWRFVSCDGHPEVSDGPPTLHVLAGSNAWWARVQIRNPPWAVAAIAWRDGNGAAGSLPYAADPENTFEVPAEVLQSSSATLALTVSYGHGATATLELEPAALATGASSYPLR